MVETGHFTFNSFHACFNKVNLKLAKLIKSAVLLKKYANETKK